MFIQTELFDLLCSYIVERDLSALSCSCRYAAELINAHIFVIEVPFLHDYNLSVAMSPYHSLTHPQLSLLTHGQSSDPNVSAGYQTPPKNRSPLATARFHERSPTHSPSRTPQRKNTTTRNLYGRTLPLTSATSASMATEFVNAALDNQTLQSHHENGTSLSTLY